MNLNRIIISRTDSIGDVVLSLPLAGILKQLYPDIYIIFLGQSYTRDLINVSEFIDEFADWNEIKKDADPLQRFKNLKANGILHVFPVKAISRLAKKAGIPFRLGTTNRIYHWFSCNKLIRLSRKYSELHESQLNLKLIGSITDVKNPSLKEIPEYYGLTKLEKLPEEFTELLSKDRFNLILHPKSKGSAREWGLENFSSLIDLLAEDRYKIFITGTEEEGRLLHQAGFISAKITDLTGKMSLSGLISFISHADGLIAASTGPLHIAAALGKIAIGLYPPIRPMHPGRWSPIGEKAHYMVLHKKCDKCRNTKKCECIESIDPEDVKTELDAIILS